MPAETFGDRLVTVRRHLGLTQDDAAERCGLNSKTWATWEMGRSPRKQGEVADRISRGLGVDRAYLLWGMAALGGSASGYKSDSIEAIVGCYEDRHELVTCAA